MRDDADDAGRSRLRWLLPALALLLIPFTAMWWPGCREFPPVTSRESLKLMQLLNSACNTKDPHRLAMAERQLAELVAKSKVTEKEKAAYDKIISMANAGHWKEAEAAAFKMAVDQVGQGHADPHGHKH